MPTSRRCWSAARIGAGGLVLFALMVHVAGKPAAPGAPGSAQGAAVPISRLIGDNVAGNGRPVVRAYGGLMVRRCEAVLLYSTTAGEPGTLRQSLHAAASAAGLRLTDVAADVLSPATLERPAPEVVACLPSGAGSAVATRLLAARLDGVERRASESVLVHALRFSVRPARGGAKALAAAIEREGILSDTLGAYGVDLTDPTGRLVITYTGPLLGDAEVESVRAAIARPDGMVVGSVAVLPLSSAGPAIDLSTEPPPSPAIGPVTPTHHH